MVALLGILLGVAAWQGPALLDWSRYRSTIAALATRALGHEVRIAGAIHLQLLPQPVLTASGITLPDAGDGVTISARQLRLRVRLAPLLTGHLQTQELVLDAPVLRLPWPPVAPGGNAVPLGRPFWLAGAAQIEDGTLSIGTLRFTGIAATLTHDPQTGGLNAAATLQFAGATWHMQGHLGVPAIDGTAGLSLVLDGAGAQHDNGGHFSGQIGSDGRISGDLAAHGPDLGLLLPAPPLPWHAAGRLSLGGGVAQLPNFVLGIGDANLTGDAIFHLPPVAGAAPLLDLALAGSRLDLDAWAPVLRQLAGGTTALPTRLRLHLLAARLQGRLLRQLAAELEVQPGGLVLHDLAAMLPGDAELHLAGQMPRSMPESFIGTATLHAPDPQPMLGWLMEAGGMGMGTLRNMPLPGADLAAQLHLTSGRITLDDLRFTLGPIMLHGTLGLGTRGPGRPAQITADLRADGLALPPDWPAQILAWPAALPRGADLDLTLRADRLGWPGAAGISPAGPLRVALTRQSDALALRKFDLQVGNLHASATGRLAADGSIAEASLSLRAADAAGLRQALPANLDGLAQSLPAAFWSPGLWDGGFALDLAAIGKPQALAVQAQAQLGAATLVAAPVIDLVHRHLAGPVTLRHPGAARLLGALLTGKSGQDWVQHWLGDGSLALVAQLDLAPAQWAAHDLRLTAAGLRATADLAFDPANAMLSGQADFDSLPLPESAPPAPWTWRWPAGVQAAVQLSAAHLVGPPPALPDLASMGSATLVAKDGMLALHRMRARLAGGTLTGDASVAMDADAAPQFHLLGALTGVTLDHPLTALPEDLLSGLSNLAVDLHASGYGAPTLLATLDGRAELHMMDGRLGGFDLGALRQALAPGQTLASALPGGGSTGFATLDAAADFANGVLTLRDAALRGPDGSATLRGVIDLPGGTLDLLARLHPLAIPAVGGGTSTEPMMALRLIGPWAAPARMADYSGLTAWLGGRR